MDLYDVLWWACTAVAVPFLIGFLVGLWLTNPKRKLP